MKNPDKKHNYGCLFLIIIFAVIVILIRYSDSIENAKSQRYHELMIQVSQEPNSEKALEIFKEAYKNATSKNERRRARSGIIALYEQMGNYSKAHSHLDEFIDEFEIIAFNDFSSKSFDNFNDGWSKGGLLRLMKLFLQASSGDKKAEDRLLVDLDIEYSNIGIKKM